MIQYPWCGCTHSCEFRIFMDQVDKSVFLGVREVLEGRQLACIFPGGPNFCPFRAGWQEQAREIGIWGREFVLPGAQALDVAQALAA